MALVGVVVNIDVHVAVLAKRVTLVDSLIVGDVVAAAVVVDDVVALLCRQTRLLFAWAQQ